MNIDSNRLLVPSVRRRASPLVKGGVTTPPAKWLRLLWVPQNSGGVIYFVLATGIKKWL